MLIDPSREVDQDLRSLLRCAVTRFERNLWDRLPNNLSTLPCPLKLLRT